MPTLQEVKVTINSRNNRELAPTYGTLTKAIWTQQERTKNGLKLFGILMGGAFCTIFVPLAHYILVPGFFISSFIFGFEKYQELEHNMGGTGECTKCHQTLKIVDSKMKSRLTDTCGNCFEELEILIDEKQ